MKRSFKSKEEEPFNYDDIQVRMLDVDDYEDRGGERMFSSCSLAHCGILKITAKQALNRLRIGKHGLIKLWNESKSIEEYYAKVDAELPQ